MLCRVESGLWAVARLCARSGEVLATCSPGPTSQLAVSGGRNATGVWRLRSAAVDATLYDGAAAPVPGWARSFAHVSAPRHQRAQPASSDSESAEVASASAHRRPQPPTARPQPAASSAHARSGQASGSGRGPHEGSSRPESRAGAGPHRHPHRAGPGPGQRAQRGAGERPAGNQPARAGGHQGSRPLYQQRAREEPGKGGGQGSPQRPRAGGWQQQRAPAAQFSNRGFQRGEGRPQRDSRENQPRPRQWQRLSHSEKESQAGSFKPKKAAKAVPPPPPPPQVVDLPSELTVRSLAASLSRPASEVERALRALGAATASQEEAVPADDAELAAMELGVTADASLARAAERARASARTAPRAPAVAVLGHVDHGKTTLLDALRKSSIAAGEAGGITQSIGAFEVPLPRSGALLTFLDTPGHAAFNAMRARGAGAADVGLLVVAADDGVMPQTREALAHLRACGTPFVVALTKCDAARADAARVRAQLAAEGVGLESQGGDVLAVEVAAPLGLGLAELEDAVLLAGELLDLVCDPAAPGSGVVVEARMDRGKGATATVLLQDGSLGVGDVLVAGTAWGRVRALLGADGRQRAGKERLTAGRAAEVTGLRQLACAGDEVRVVGSEARAEALVRAREARARLRSMDAERGAQEGRDARVERAFAEARLAMGARGMPGRRRKAAAAAVLGAAAAGEEDEEAQGLKLVLKADVQGSVEAVQAALEALSCGQAGVQIVHAGVGPVSESDVCLAAALGARVAAFNVRACGADVAAAARRQGVAVLAHRVIYHLMDEVEGLLRGAAPRVERERQLGQGAVLQVFVVKPARGKAGSAIAGCRVGDGQFQAGESFRVRRADGRVAWTGRAASLRRVKLDVQTVGKGSECGLVLQGFEDLRQGDAIECFTIDMVAPAAPEQ